MVQNCESNPKTEYTTAVINPSMVQNCESNPKTV
jgi:hypothetical protein